MSSEERTTEETTQHSDDVLEEETKGLQQPNNPEKLAVQKTLTATQQGTVPTPSPSTDGSISVYIEKTLQASGGRETGPRVTFLPYLLCVRCWAGRRNSKGIRVHRITS